MAALTLLPDQAVTGVSPPGAGEALVREIWPSVTTSAAAAGLAKNLQRTIFLAPLGWLVLAPVFGMRLMGFLPGLGGLATRYRLTNRRLGIFTGFPPRVSREVPLERIHDVKVTSDDDSGFYLAGTLNVLDANGTTILTLPGVSEPESVRIAIMQTVAAWAPLSKSV